jgi:hypothetical protein
MVRLYGEPFGLNDVKSTIESVYGRIQKVAALDSTLLTDFEECLRVIENAKSSISDIGSFLAYDFLTPFLNNSESVLNRYLATMRARFATHIEHPGGGMSQVLLKRYGAVRNVVGIDDGIVSGW